MGAAAAAQRERQAAAFARAIDEGLQAGVDAALMGTSAFNPNVIDVAGAAAENLAAAGYPAPGKRLAYSTVICEPNIDELPDLSDFSGSN